MSDIELISSSAAKVEPLQIQRSLIPDMVVIALKKLPYGQASKIEDANNAIQEKERKVEQISGSISELKKQARSNADGYDVFIMRGMVIGMLLGIFIGMLLSIIFLHPMIFFLPALIVMVIGLVGGACLGYGITYLLCQLDRLNLKLTIWLYEKERESNKAKIEAECQKLIPLLLQCNDLQQKGVPTGA